MEILPRKEVLEFEEKQVEDKVFFEILKECFYSISANEEQEWEIVLIKEKKLKEEIAQKHYLSLISESSICFLIIFDLNRMKRRFGEKGYELGIQDCFGLATTFWFVSKEYDLKCEIIRNLDEEFLRLKLNIPENYKIVCMVVVGYSKNEKERVGRIDYKKVLHVDKFGGKFLSLLERILEGIKEGLK